MRTIKELLILMMCNTHLFKEGLCSWKARLYWNNIITLEECELLDQYIEDNRPSKFSSIDAFIHKNNVYYWKACNIKPRIKWLKKHIRLNNK